MNELVRCRRATAAAISLWLLASASVLAHGGAYRMPDNATTTSTPGGTPSTSGPTTLSDAPNWRLWWLLNWDRLVDLRGRLSKVQGTGEQGERVRGWRPLSAKEKAEKLLQPLLYATELKDAEVRAAAAIALGKLAIPEATTPLLKLLEDRDRLVRNAAALALGMNGDSAAEETMLSTFRSSSTADDTRSWLAVGLGYLGTQKAVDELVRQLGVLYGRQVPGSNREVVMCCAAGLTVCANKAAAPAIIEVLEKSRGRRAPTQAILLLALGKLGDRAALPMLAEHLDERDNIVQSAAIAAAGQLAIPDDTEIVKKLAKIADDEAHATNRALAMIALGRIGGAQARSVLQAELGSGSRKRFLVDLRPFAASALAIAGERSDQNQILTHLNTPVVYNRGAYALSLALLGDAGAEAIVTMLKAEKNDQTFAELALAAGLMQAREATDHLRSVLNHERRADFRTSAAIALALLGDAEALDKVLQLMDEVKSASQQAPLVFALTLFGNHKGVDALSQLLVQSRVQDNVKALCCVALGNIGDTRRYPALSSLSMDWTWMVTTPVLDEMVMLY